MKNDIFEKTFSARTEFKKNFLDAITGDSTFYVIDNLDFNQSGVWALFGKSNKLKNKWFCLQVGQTNNIAREIRSDILLMESELELDRKKKYVNQFGECLFEYDEKASAREILYNRIKKDYCDLVFVCIYNTIEYSLKKEIESYFARATHALFWRNGKPFTDGEEIDLTNICCDLNLDSTLDVSIKNNIDIFINKFNINKEYDV